MGNLPSSDDILFRENVQRMFAIDIIEVNEAQILPLHILRQFVHQFFINSKPIILLFVLLFQKYLHLWFSWRILWGVGRGPGCRIRNRRLLCCRRWNCPGERLEISSAERSCRWRSRRPGIGLLGQSLYRIQGLGTLSSSNSHFFIILLYFWIFGFFEFLEIWRFGDFWRFLFLVFLVFFYCFIVLFFYFLYFTGSWLGRL